MFQGEDALSVFPSGPSDHLEDSHGWPEISPAETAERSKKSNHGDDDTSVDSPTKPSSASSPPPPPLPRPPHPLPAPPSLANANLPSVVTRPVPAVPLQADMERRLSLVTPAIPLTATVYQAILDIGCQRDTTGAYATLKQDPDAMRAFGTVLERVRLFAATVATYTELPKATTSKINTIQLWHEGSELNRNIPRLVESVRLLHYIETVVLPQCKADIQELSPVRASDIREAQTADAQARETIRRIADNPARTPVLAQACATVMAAYAHLTTIQTYAARFSEQVGRVFHPSVFAWLVLMAWVQVDTLLAYRSVKASLDRSLQEPVTDIPLWLKPILTECHRHFQGIFALNTAAAGDGMSYKPTDMGYQCVQCHRALTPITPSQQNSPWFVSSTLAGTAPLAMWPWKQPEHNCTFCMVTKEGGAALDSWCNDALHDSFQSAMLTESKPWMTLAEPVLLDLIQHMSEKAL